LLTKHFKLFSEKAHKTFKSPEETANLFEGAMHGRHDCAQNFLFWTRILPNIIETANAIAEGQGQQEETADASRKHEARRWGSKETARLYQTHVF
jgi:hypothetical protein